MFGKDGFRSRVLVVGVLAAFLLLVTPVREFAQSQAPALSGGSLVGFIYDKDMKTPVPNAVIKLRNLKNAKDYVSTPSDTNGMYKITGIEEGRYILGVTAAKHDFNFDYALVLKGNELAKLSVALSPGGKMSGPDAESKSFFKGDTWFGIALLAAVAGIVLYNALEKEETSPVR
jgi:hypothetical protein